jgi:hypothetical protein
VLNSVTVTAAPGVTEVSFYMNKEDGWFCYDDPSPEPDAAEASANADNIDYQRHRRVRDLEVQPIGFLLLCAFVQPNVSPRIAQSVRDVGLTR